MADSMNRGFFAAKWVKECGGEDEHFVACGAFIDDSDFFEAERKTLIEQFRKSGIQDDIYAMMHKEELA